MKYTQKEIGEKLAFLRKQKGYSQEELAKNLLISRSSLAQIELGNRGVDYLEMIKFSEILGFSLDYLMVESSSDSADFILREVETSYETKERLSEPKPNVSKLKNILLYVLESCAGKPNVGEFMVHKIMYFCDFNFYEMYEEQLTGSEYKKMPFGPVSSEITSMLNTLISSEQILQIKNEYLGKIVLRFIPLTRTDLSSLRAHEVEVVNRVIDQLGNYSNESLFRYIQIDMPWQATSDGEPIDYELVFYREAPYSVRIYDTDEEP
jgi:transcriptional regulator with XRE-family HTH domain